MNASDFDAVTYNSAVWCVSCLPDEVDVDSDEVAPIFASEEMDRYPVCDHCHAEHDYVNLTTDGRIWKRERNWSRKMRDFSKRLRQDGQSETARELPHYAWPGGYTMIYVDNEGNEYCGKCANNCDLELPLRDCGSYDEGPTIQCAECGDDIESSYGDPEAEGEDA